MIDHLRPLFLSIVMIGAVLSSGLYALDLPPDGAQAHMAMATASADCGMTDCPHDHDGMHSDPNGLCSGAAGSCVTAMIRLSDCGDAFVRSTSSFPCTSFDKTGPSRIPETETPPPRV